MFDWLFGRKKIGLALGGGVARGIAHIGVLKVLHKNKIPIHCIAGTSSGALIGAAYAAGMEPQLIEDLALRISWGKIIKVAFFRPGFISGDAIEEFIAKYIGDCKFAELKIPFAAVATDLKTGETVIINEGRIGKAVAASASFPAVFTPGQVKHHMVTDGGIAANLPVDVVKMMGANFAVAVDVVPTHPFHTLPKDAFQVFGRSLDMVLHKLSLDQRGKADLLIEPQMEEDIWHLDLNKAQRLIAAGEAAAHKAIGKLRRLI
ncbi:MAG: patatin-like phospholipase family protein [Candidatus Margulisbacteria bacterium]|nr:patatin-like phospholipase family protein [Candidatus Margulisiibacteriota bacterium]